MIKVPDLLTTVMTDPGRAGGLSQSEWECLVWQARAAELMAQLHDVLARAGLLELAPAPARRHLELAWTIAGRHARAVEAELRAIEEALAPLQIPVLLLKGAAYAVSGHLAARGRIFNDIDLMVPKAALDAVEQRLSTVGWISQHGNAYDERYYREWMHEIPPMEHKLRGTVLDVHHTILPPTSGHRPDPQALFEASTSADPPWQFFRVLGPADMVIHSSCHLFYGEFHKGLRDLHDLHTLLGEFGVDPRFWSALVERALALGLQRPVLDALQQCHRVFGTLVPSDGLQALKSACCLGWPTPLRAWLFRQALRPAHPSAVTQSTRLARFLVFVRSHWLRMPLGLLTYHVGHKLFVAR